MLISETISGRNFRLVVFIISVPRRTVKVIWSWWHTTATGERHLWVHDFNSISKYLRLSGFSDIQKVNAHKCAEPDFPIYPLDINSEGLSRKGIESMYIEARNN